MRENQVGQAVRQVGQAVTVEQLVRWAWQAEQVGTVLGRAVGWMDAERAAAGITWHGASADGVATMMRQGVLGCRVDGGGPVVAPDVHPDAEAVFDAVGQLGRVARGLVAQHARAGSRPDWLPGAAVEWQPVRGSDGAMRLIMDRNGRRVVGAQVEAIVTVAHPGEARRVEPGVLPETIAWRRELYLSWWDGLDALADALACGLRDHRVVGVGPARSPWEGLDGGEGLT